CVSTFEESIAAQALPRKGGASSSQDSFKRGSGREGPLADQATRFGNVVLHRPVAMHEGDRLAQPCMRRADGAARPEFVGLRQLRGQGLQLRLELRALGIR